jgi:hypothetical protein
MADWTDAPILSQPVKRLLFSMLIDLSVVAQDQAIRSEPVDLQLSSPPIGKRAHLTPVAVGVTDTATSISPGHAPGISRRLGDISVFDYLPDCAAHQSDAWRSTFAGLFRQLAFDIVYYGFPITRSPAEEVALHMSIWIGAPHTHPAIRNEWRSLRDLLFPDSMMLLHYSHGTAPGPRQAAPPAAPPMASLSPDEWFREYRPRFPVLRRPLPDAQNADRTPSFDEARGALPRSTPTAREAQPTSCPPGAVSPAIARRDLS